MCTTILQLINNTLIVNKLKLARSAGGCGGCRKIVLFLVVKLYSKCLKCTTGLLYSVQHPLHVHVLSLVVSFIVTRPTYSVQL